MTDVELSVVRRPQVLLVEPEVSDREWHGKWLDESGFDVINCPGPHLTGYSCLGLRGLPCALRDAADVVVLDARARGSGLSRETPSWRLLRYYLSSGKPVVVIADKYHPDRTYRPEQVFPLQPNPGRESLLLAVRQLMLRAEEWSGERRPASQPLTAG